MRLGILLLLLATAGFGQSGTRKLITVNAVATDKLGHPVSGLLGENFRISDNGKPQTISFFRQSTSAPHTTVILLDLLNNRLGSRSYGATEITHALEQSESNADIYLYFLTLSGKLFPAVALPASGQPVKQALRESDSAISQSVENAMNAVSQLRPAGVPIDLQIQETYTALAALGQQMVRFPGRKSLVWVTHGVPIEIRLATGQFFDYTPMLARLSKSLKDAGIAVYPVAISDQNMMRSQQSLQTLENIAGLTGGQMLTGDVAAAIEKASLDERGVYILQYYSPDQKQNGKYHKLHVTCERKDIDVLSERGYYAAAKSDSDQQAQNADPTDALRNAALLSPYDYKAIPLTAKVTKNPGKPPSAHYELQIGIARLIPVDGSEASYSGNVLMTYAEYDNEALPQVSQPTPVKFNAGSKGEIRFAGDMQLERDVRSIRFVVVDPVTRAVGSVTIPMSAVR